MADLNLRGLERQMHSGGDLETRAKWMRTQVRAGNLTPKAIRLAAYVGDEAARLVESPPGGQSWWEYCERDNFSAWLYGLTHWGYVTVVRVAVAIAQEVLPVWEAVNEKPEGYGNGWYVHHPEDIFGPRRAVKAAEAWLANPTEKNCKYAIKVAVSLPEQMNPGRLHGPIAQDAIDLGFETEIGAALWAYNAALPFGAPGLIMRESDRAGEILGESIQASQSEYQLTEEKIRSIIRSTLVP